MGAIKSAKYLFVGGLFSKAISFIGSILLARILFPEDFGYLLIAVIITGFIQVFGNIGFETFYLQEKINSKEHEAKVLNITFKLRLLVNTFLFFLQIGVSFIAEKYYDNPMIGDLIRIYALSIPIMAFSQINLYILRKKLNYKPEVFANIGRDVVGTVVKVFFALIGFGALSFAIGGVVGNIIRFFILVSYQKFKPDWKLWDKEIFEKIFYFGKHSFIGGIALFFSQYMDKIILTNFFPAFTSGLYSFSNAQANMFSSYLIQPQASLVISYSAKYKSNSSYLLSKLSDISYLITMVSIPVLFFLYNFSAPLFDIIFGEKWHNAVPLFQLFIVNAFIQIVFFPIAGILTAFGYPQIASKIVLVQVVILTPALLLTAMYSQDIQLYVSVFICMSLIFSIIKAYFSLKLLGSNLKKYFYNIRFSLVLGMINMLLLIFMHTLSYHIGIILLLSIIISIFINIITIFVFDGTRFLSAFKVFVGKENKIYKSVYCYHKKMRGSCV